ncbi:serine/threonine-protein kinase [Antrihabitans stalactiti]|uniref:serine/threonine-protein kinase n=1 Tax=Antrihabitans stalactiti TaxID=2584121 RepID=UPI0030B84421
MSASQPKRPGDVAGPTIDVDRTIAVDQPTEAGNVLETDNEPGAQTRLVLASAVAEFDAAWKRADSPPALADFVPDAPGRRACVIELVKVDLDHRWRPGGEPKRLSSYIAEFGELSAQPVPPDLIYEEFQCRRRYGEPVDPQEYRQAFPDQWQFVAPFLGANDRSTVVVRPQQRDELEDLVVGDSIDDFDLRAALGRGAFARVFLARQRSMERFVALKISHNHGSEPQTMAQLDHEYIVRVFDQRLIADRDLKLMYMEYVRGGTLLGVLEYVAATDPDQRDGHLLLDAIDDGAQDEPSGSSIRDEIAALSWPETVAWLGRRLADALDYAAQRGVLHRDIKPANVLLTAEGVPKLADFNISFSNHIAGASPAAYFGGSLSYMSPEQLEACHPHIARGASDLDERSDMYALGVLLWELLTGRHPFRDETKAGESETSLQRMLEVRRRGIEPARISELPPDCPATLRRVLLTCLAAKPEDRFSTNAELAQQLELCLDARARDLVDPPAGSLRARLGLRPIPVVMSSVVFGQALGMLYLFMHNYRLVQNNITPDAKSQLDLRIILVVALVIPLCGGLMFFLCRRVLSVPWGMWRGKVYEPAELDRARADTLACGDRIALTGFVAWVAALLLLGGAVAAIGNLSAGLVDNLVASHLVAGAVAVTYPLFLIEFYVVRWYLPALLTRGTTSMSDAWRLRALARRCNLYLAIVGSVPAVGVIAGIAFLDRQQVRQIVGSIVWLCVTGIAAFVVAYWLFRKLEMDLAALERMVTARAKRRTGHRDLRTVVRRPVRSIPS